MAKTSAGLLMFRLRNGEPEVLLVHPGGPFWAKKDEEAWSKAASWSRRGPWKATAIQRSCAATCSLEWPPKSGKRQQFPEVDRAEWFSVTVALRKINPAQRGFVSELATRAPMA